MAMEGWWLFTQLQNLRRVVNPKMVGLVVSGWWWKGWGMVLKYFDIFSISKNTSLGVYKLRYSFNGVRYNLISPVKRGPKKWDRVEDAHRNDITTYIDECAGPCHNFHGITTTPGMLGYLSLHFYKRDNLVASFAERDPILLP